MKQSVSALDVPKRIRFAQNRRIALIERRFHWDLEETEPVAHGAIHRRYQKDLQEVVDEMSGR